MAQDACLGVECGRGKGRSIKHAEWPKAVSKHAVVQSGPGLGIGRIPFDWAQDRLRYAAPLRFAATQDALLSLVCGLSKSKLVKHAEWAEGPYRSMR